MTLQYRNYLILSLMALSLCVLPQGSPAANYYVDYEGGSDSNSGASTGAAFKHVPGDTTATGSAASTTLTAGDTVYFKGGVRYVVPPNATWNLNWNGAAGSPITYDGNSAGAWGTGKAIITDNHAVEPNTLRSVVYASGLRKWLVFDNLEFTELGGSETLPVDPGSPISRNAAIAINFSSGLSNVVVRNCYFHEIGYYWHQKPMQASTVSGNGIQTINCDGLTVTNCEFTRMNIGLEISASSYITNLTVVDCRFHNSLTWAVDMAPTSSGARLGAINLHGNHLYNFGEFGSGSWTGYGEWPHVDGFFLRCDYPGATYCTNNDATGINFYNNTFYDTNQISANGTACIYVAAGPSCNIYNNLFIHTLKTRTIFIGRGFSSGSTPQVVRIYNNTFVEDYQACIGMSTGGHLLGDITIKNNIFYDVRQGSSANVVLHIEDFPIASSLVMDYNLYSSQNAAGTYVSWAGVAGGLQLMRSRGMEMNGIFGDPKFMDISYGSGPRCNLNVLQLQPTSPAINAGTRVPVLFTTDRLAVSRPQGGAWDIGAYEHLGSGSDLPEQPENLRLQTPSQ